VVFFFYLSQLQIVKNICYGASSCFFNLPGLEEGKKSAIYWLKFKTIMKN